MTTETNDPQHGVDGWVLEEFEWNEHSPRHHLEWVRRYRYSNRTTRQTATVVYTVGRRKNVDVRTARYVA